MEDKELIKTIEFTQGAYSRTLTAPEIKLLKEELKDYDYNKFIENLKFPLLKKVDFFTVASLHKIIEEDQELERFKQSLGIKSFDELYEN